MIPHFLEMYVSQSWEHGSISESATRLSVRELKCLSRDQAMADMQSGTYRVSEQWFQLSGAQKAAGFSAVYPEKDQQHGMDTEYPPLVFYVRLLRTFKREASAARQTPTLHSPGSFVTDGRNGDSGTHYFLDVVLYHFDVPL